jgi:hypothetical protein
LKRGAGREKGDIEIFIFPPISLFYLSEPPLIDKKGFRRKSNYFISEKRDV